MDGFKGNGLRKAMVFADDEDDRFWVSGMTNDTAVVEAMSESLVSLSLLFDLFEFLFNVFDKK